MDSLRSSGKTYAPLPFTGPEVAALEQAFRAKYPLEPIQVWTGAEATESRLKALAEPPRILHLATHGSMLSDQEAARLHPLASSTVALNQTKAYFRAHPNRAYRDPRIWSAYQMYQG